MIDPQQQSQSLLDAVFRFFEMYPQQVRIEKNLLMGTAEITLSGDLARIFKAQTTPHPSLENCRVLKLLLDSRVAQAARGYQTVAPRSRLIKMIENRLQDEKVRYVRSVAAVNLARTFRDLASLGVSVRHAQPSVRCEQHMRRFFIATYLFQQSAYECQEDYIPIVMDANSAETVPPSLAGMFAHLKYLDCNEIESPDVIQSLLQPAPAVQIESILDRAENEARQRARAVANRMHQTKNAEYQAELQRAKLAYEADRNSTNSPAKKSQLKVLHDEKVQKLEQLYAVQSELTLSSLQEVQVPLVTYHLMTQLAGTMVDLDKRFFYNPLGDQVSTEFCDNCGHGADHKEWNFCRRGVHLECGSCNSIRHCDEPQCQNTACQNHSVSCSFCEREVCLEHEKRCQYCETNEIYCGDCVSTSWEFKDICGTCSAECSCCQQVFPAETHLKFCVVCKEQFCGEHVFDCNGCGHPVCEKDRGPVENREGGFCRTCQDICVECPDHFKHFINDLATCKIGDEPVCATHRTDCIACNGAICSEHQLETANGLGCPECFASCQSCQGLPVAIETLAECVHCPPGMSLHCLSKGHAIECSICKGNVCNSHRLMLASGRYACKACAKGCAVCHHFFDPKDTVRCNQCGVYMCHEHHVKSGFDGSPFCPRHSDEFVTCQGCNARGQQPKAHQCDLCRHRYGSCCMESSTRCKYCSHFKPISSDQIMSILPAELDESFSRKPSLYDWELSRNSNHMILKATYKGGVFGFISRKFVKDKSYLVICANDSSQHSFRVL